MISRDAPVGALNTDPSYRHQFGGVPIVDSSNQLLTRRLRVVHNHPSGDPTPSTDDVAMTQEIRAAVSAIGVTLHDHVVIGNGTWFSFRRKGLL